MPQDDTSVSYIAPVLTRRESGGWLAVSAPGSTLRIGVEGRSKEEATERFSRSVRRWADLLREAYVS